MQLYPISFEKFFWCKLPKICADIVNINKRSVSGREFVVEESVNEKTHDDKKQNDKKKKLLIGGLVAVIVVLVVVIVVLLMRGQEEEPEDARNVVVTQDTVDDVMDDIFEGDYIPVGYYSVSMSTTWHFATGGAMSEDAYVQNLEENTNDVYFDVFLAENEDEAIYKSPILPRGSELNRIALDKELSAGTYDCVMVYHLVDEEQNTLSTLRVAFTIIIEA